MIEKSELLQAPAFTGLPDDQIDWFLRQSQELKFSAGETYTRQGDAADAMFVVIEGQLELRGEVGGEAFLFFLSPGDVTGARAVATALPPSLNTTTTASRRSISLPAAGFRTTPRTVS